MMRFFSPRFAQVGPVLRRPPTPSLPNRFILREGKYASFHAAVPHKTEAEKFFSLAQRHMKADPYLAIRYLEEAAEQAHTGAQSLLGEYYLKGMYVEADVKKGVSYLQLAAEKGDETAIACLDTAAQKGYKNAEEALDALPHIKEAMQTSGLKK